MELKVWIGSVQRIICGISPTTTSQEVIVALAQATGKTGRFTLIEKWRDYERTLAPTDYPLALAQKFGEYAHEVQFILRQTSETTSASSRRLADAKSPKPRRRRTSIKKSLSFSGGSQQPERTARIAPQVSSIAEEHTSLPSSIEQTPSHDRHPPADHRSNQRRDGGMQSASPQYNPAEEQRKRERAEARAKAREGEHLERSIADHETELEKNKEMLSLLEQEIVAVTNVEEKKWCQLYDCQEEINQALVAIHQLEEELEDYDEVLLSEELNVILRKQAEVQEEINALTHSVKQTDSQLENKTKQSNELVTKLKRLDKETEEIDSLLADHEMETKALQRKVNDKQKFLVDAEQGYKSACDDLKEAEAYLEKRKQMREELERELREYNLKHFISTGFTEKADRILVSDSHMGEDLYL